MNIVVNTANPVRKYPCILQFVRDSSCIVLFDKPGCGITLKYPGNVEIGKYSETWDKNENSWKPFVGTITLSN